MATKKGAKSSKGSKGGKGTKKGGSKKGGYYGGFGTAYRESQRQRPKR